MTTEEERTRLAQALNDIDMRVHGNLSSDEILQSALDGLVAALRADAGDIKILDDGVWHVRYQHGFDPTVLGTQLTPDIAPVAEEAARTRQPVVVSDYLESETVPYVGFPAWHELRAVVAVPLIVRDEVAGCLFAWMRTPRSFDRWEVNFARRVAASVALALENARLYERQKAARARAEEAERALSAELERTRVLLKASDELTSTNDPDELLVRLGRVVLEATGLSRVFINLIDTQRQLLFPRVATGGLIRPRGRQVSFDELSQTSLEAIRAGVTAILDYETPDTPAADREIAQANSARLVLFVPLTHQGEIVGHITVDEPGERCEFRPDQVRIVESIATQATIALQNARLYARDHRIAEVLQESLLGGSETMAGFEIARVYRPASASANVGGDFYDMFPLDDRLLAVVLGDVSGKGLNAAQLTSLIRDGARAYLIEDPDPGTCFSRLNALACRFTPVDRFATAFLAVIDRFTGEMRYCCAAHPAPMILGGDGVRTLDPGQAMLLGAFPEATFEAHETVIDVDEILVGVTDGVTEARHGTQMYGEERLLEALEDLRGTAPGDLPDALLERVTRFTDRGLRDDVVIVCVSRDGSQPT